MPPLDPPQIKTAENVKAGDVFQFHGNTYVCLNGLTDQRHTQTILTCVDGRSLNVVRSVFVLRLLRTFKVAVTSTCFIPLHVLEHQPGEITPQMETECGELIKAFLQSIAEQPDPEIPGHKRE